MIGREREREREREKGIGWGGGGRGSKKDEKLSAWSMCLINMGLFQIGDLIRDYARDLNRVLKNLFLYLRSVCSKSALAC